MISFRSGGYRFHYRAGAIILDADYLLVHRLQGDDFWALPGGRVNAGESAQAAIVRELAEEFQVQIKCGSLACTGENFFEHEGEAHHEIGLYFFAQLPADSPYLDKSQTHMGVEGMNALEFRWVPVRELATIELRPHAIQSGLIAGQLPSHFLQRG